jgi:protein-tyrosine-phosphatase
MPNNGKHRAIMVCTGNICRSPMAEGLLRDRWQRMGRTDLVVSSMGIHGLDAHPASHHAREICAENGIDISGHLSRPLVPEEMSEAFVIFTMERMQKEFVQLFHPDARGKVFLLAAWPGKETRKSNVEDPIGASERVYRRVYDTIESHIDRIVPHLAALL